MNQSLLYFFLELLTRVTSYVQSSKNFIVGHSEPNSHLMWMHCGICKYAGLFYKWLSRDLESHTEMKWAQSQQHIRKQHQHISEQPSPFTPVNKHHPFSILHSVDVVDKQAQFNIPCRYLLKSKTQIHWQANLWMKKDLVANIAYHYNIARVHAQKNSLENV